MKPIYAAAILATLSTALDAAPMDPLALYQFDNDDAADTSGNGNDGTIGTGVTFADSQPGFGRAADFSPISSLSGIDTGLDINPSVFAALTMGAWINPNTVGTGFNGPGKMLSHDDMGFDRTLGFDDRGNDPGDDNISAFTGTGVASIDGPFSDFGEWTHYAVRYDGSNSAIFRNGVVAETFNATNGFSSRNLFIGTNPGFDEDFDGLMDDVFVYGRALSDAELLDIYENGFTTTVVPLPTGLPLLLAGLGALAWARRRV